MLKAFKYQLYPTTQQVGQLNQILQLCRFLYNCMLKQRIWCFKAGKSVGKFDQLNELSQIKAEFPEYKTVFSQVLQDVGVRLEKAYQNFFRRMKAGDTPGFPRFKGKNWFDSFTYTQSGFGFVDGKLRLSKIGDIKIKLHRALEGKVKTCTILRKNGKYYVSFSCEAPTLPLPTTGQSVGIDVGVADFAITSGGEFFPKQAAYRKAEKRLISMLPMILCLTSPKSKF